MKNNDYHNLLLKSLPESYRVWFDAEKQYLEKHIKTGSSVLEIGSGDGRSIYDLLPLTKNITAVDHDKEAVIRAQQSFADFSSIKIIETDAVNLPFNNESFDYVICMGTFMNLGEKKYHILNEMKRVLKNDGKIIVSTFSDKALSERLNMYKKVGAPIKEIRGGTVIFNESLGSNISEQFSLHELTDIFTQAGFVVQDVSEVSIAYLCTLSKK